MLWDTFLCHPRCKKFLSTKEEEENTIPAEKWKKRIQLKKKLRKNKLNSSCIEVEKKTKNVMGEIAEIK